MSADTPASRRSSRTPRGVRGLKYWLPVVEDVKGYVAPLAGCVDWNETVADEFTTLGRRTPRGVRGLKYPAIPLLITVPGRTPRGVRGLKSHLTHHPSRIGRVAPLAGCVD